MRQALGGAALGVLTGRPLRGPVCPVGGVQPAAHHPAQPRHERVREQRDDDEQSFASETGVFAATLRIRAGPRPCQWMLMRATPTTTTPAAANRGRPIFSRKKTAPMIAPVITPVSRRAATAASAPRVCAHTTMP